MPTKTVKKSFLVTVKHQKLEHGKQARVFASAEEISAALRTQNHDLVVENLTTLRNQLSIRPGEDAISPQDERLLLAQRWMENVPGAHDIFGIWDNLTQRQNSIFALLVSILSSLLALLSSHYTFQAYGQPIIKTLLTPTYTRRLNSYLGGTHAELILVTLKLFNTMSAFGGGREKKSVLESFGWELKSLPKLMNMRRKSRAEDASDALTKPDIRTFYMLFILSFVAPESPAQVKTAFIEQHRDPFLSIFKGLLQDSYPVIRKVLEVCWAGIWSDPKVKRTLKIGLFNEITISHLLKLYDSTVPEGDDPDHIPADLAHHFLLAICTRQGTGICFKDRGWYPRESNSDSHDDEPVRGKIYNKILANILKSLKVNEDLRQQELAFKIMSACPELVSGYWARAALTLEPRLSSKWIANIAFFGSVISLPVPTASFYLPNTALYQPAPPPLSNIIENIFPSVNTKAHFSKGLQSPSGLVQHCTAIALAKCLTKYEAVIAAFQDVEASLEENEADGQWSKRRRDTEREVRRRVPDFQVVVAFSQQKFGDVPATPGVPAAQPNPTRTALLAESADRLLWMYHRCLPLMVAEARFDVGKLLQNFSIEGREVKVQDESSSDAATRLNAVRQLHVLRLLKDSDQFGWSGKMGSTSQSYLAVLLKAYMVSENPATLTALSDLLQHILSESILFQDDPTEPHLWLISLPNSQRAHGTESPDGAPLTDESDSVITFLDDCVQRYMKTPYRYIEDLHSLANVVAPSSANKFDVLPSPLLMTALEQLEIKVTKKLLSSSDVLALASFVRKLVFRLAGKQQDLTFLGAVVGKVDVMFHIDRLFSEFPVISAAIRREVELLKACLSPAPDLPPPRESSEQVQGFLSAIEKMPIPTKKMTCKTTASELVDWIRLVEDTLGAEEIRRVSYILLKLYPPSLSLVVEHVVPGGGRLWDGLGVVSALPEIRRHLHFDFLLLHASSTQIADEACRDILAEAALGREPSLAEVKRAICLICHRLTGGGDDSQTKDLFLLLTSILRRSSTALPAPDFAALKEAVFVRSRAIKSSLASDSLTDVVRQGLHRLVEDVLNPANASDRMLIGDTTAYWLEVLSSNLAGVGIPRSLVSIWVKYFQPRDLFGLLDALLADMGMPSSSTLDHLGDILAALKMMTDAEVDSEKELIRRLPQLMALRPVLTGSIVLEELIAIAVDSSMPAYCDGRGCGEAVEETKLVSIVQRAEMRWSRQLDSALVDLPIQAFLTQDSWSASTMTIVSGLIYRRRLPVNDFTSWLAAEHCTRRSPEHFASVMHAFLDAALAHDEAIESADSDVWLPQLSRLLAAVLNDRLPEDTRSISAACMTLIMRLVPSRASDFVSEIIPAIQAFPVTKLSTHLLSVGRRLHSKSPSKATPLVTELVNHGIQWAIRSLADDEGASFDRAIEELILLVQSASGVKPHLVETVMGVVIQIRLACVPAVRLITALLFTVHLKPVVVNRHLQSILQHPNFFKFCANQRADDSTMRDAIVRLLHVLFHLHPTNTCQTTHVEPLVRIYRGTLSPADGQILSIFRLFEAEKKVSIAALLSRWSSTPNSLSNTSLEAIQSLDPVLVLRTCLNFPRWRRLEDLVTEKATVHDAQLYDPVFLILLFAQTLVDNVPDSAFVWVELFRTNIVSLLIRALSSKDGAIREVALCQIAALWKLLETADMQERLHILHILNLLKDVVPSPTDVDEPPRRLPSYTALLLLHALRGIFYPSNFMYPLTARFLLQRPELDTNDVPMLYNMLYSSSDDWKKERGWMIRFLSDGMMSTDDWRVLKGRHTWDLLASLFQSSEDDRTLRASILEVLANLTCNAQAMTSLVLKSGLLSWIEIQLLTSTDINSVEWVKILDNIMTILNPEKLESSTNGEWRSVICRCLMVLVDSSRPSNNITAFLLAVQAALRLSLLPGPKILELPLLLEHSVEGLKRLESSATVPPSSIGTGPLRHPPSPLYRSPEIHDPVRCNDSLQIWGAAVEALWRISMTLDEASGTWDAITCRMLAWRALVGADNDLSEWARTQVIRNMAT